MGVYDIRRLPAADGGMAGLALNAEDRLPHHEESIVIAAPVESVFAAMTDLERWKSWWPQIESVRLADGWTVDGDLACRVMGMDLEGAVTSYELDRELGFETNLPVGGRVRQHFTFHSEDGRTRLTAELDASGIAGMMFTRKRLLKEMDRLKANVEKTETD